MGGDPEAACSDAELLLSITFLVASCRVWPCRLTVVCGGLFQGSRVPESVLLHCLVLTTTHDTRDGGMPVMTLIIPIIALSLPYFSCTSSPRLLARAAAW